jgi:hypothetical protein
MNFFKQKFYHININFQEHEIELVKEMINI